MNFDFSPEQDEAGALAARILDDKATNEQMKAVEAAGDRFDPQLWQALAEAGLLSLWLPEQYGGAGLGVLELCRVLVEVGRTVAPVPVAVHGASALALAELGSEEQAATWLPGAASGEVVLTAAISEALVANPEEPTTGAVLDADQVDAWVVTGTKVVVPAGMRADLFLVPAATATGNAVFLVRPDDEGVVRTAQRLSDGDEAAELVLTDVRLGADRMLGNAADGTTDRRLRDLVVLAATAQQLGTTHGALQLTAAYAREREQFGRPIGTFQAVAQRLADGYIDVLGQRLTLWQAAWRLSEGLPATTELAMAKLFAADAGHKLAHTTVHVHGGVGIDLDGTAHRYFTAGKRYEFLYGGTTDQARIIGRELAQERV